MQNAVIKMINRKIIKLSWLTYSFNCLSYLSIENKLLNSLRKFEGSKITWFYLPVTCEVQRKWTISVFKRKGIWSDLVSGGGGGALFYWLLPLISPMSQDISIYFYSLNLILGMELGSVTSLFVKIYYFKVYSILKTYIYLY